MNAIHFIDLDNLEDWHMLRSYLFIILFLSSLSLFGYQDNFLNLVTPTQLNDWDGEITISHRFYGNVDEKPLDTFFGMDNGANTGLFFRKNFVKSLELQLGYSKAKNEYTITGSHRFTKADFPVQGQVNLQYFTFKELNQDKRRNNVLILAAVQNKPFKDKFILNMNIGYDGYYKRLVNGFGLGFKAKDNVSVLGEYYPVWDRNTATDKLAKYLGKHDAYAFGFKYDTYGHQFTLMVGNSSESSVRKISMGTFSSSDLKFGFNIQRRFEH
jgi:hypothetical protein